MMHDINWNSITPSNTLCRLMLGLATGPFTKKNRKRNGLLCIASLIEELCIRVHLWQLSICYQACGGARTDGWQWIPGWLRGTRSAQPSLKCLVPMLWCVFKTKPASRFQTECLWVCVLEFCELPFLDPGTFQVFRSAILDGMRAVRTHAQETWQPKPNEFVIAWPMALQELLGLVQLSMLGFSDIKKLWKVMKQLYFLVSNNISLSMEPSKWFKYIVKYYEILWYWIIYMYRSWIWQWDDIQDGNFLWGLDRRIARWTAFATREAILRQRLGSFIEERDVKRWQKLGRT